MNETAESLRGKVFPVLDSGFIRVLDWMGDDAAVTQAARISYGAGTKSVSDDRALIRYLYRHGHMSPFEMCLAGGTLIPTSPCHGATQKTYTIRELAEAFESGRSGSWARLVLIRAVNPETGVISRARIRRAWKTGRRVVFRVTESSVARRSIVLTDDHPFLCPDGQFRDIRSLKVGDHISLNGRTATAPEVIAEAVAMRARGQGIKEIGIILGISPSTAFKFIQEAGLTGRVKRRPHLRKPTGSHADPRAIARKVIGFRGQCRFPECRSAARNIHHQDEDPHNNDPANLFPLCVKHHRVVHRMSLVGHTVSTTISSIEPAGEEDVYDLEIDSPNHAFVAEGLVVHNCELKLHIRLPMDCHRQLVRHRAAHLNEYSTRYSEAIDAAQQTSPDAWRAQAKDNKQGSGGTVTDWPADYHRSEVKDHTGPQPSLRPVIDDERGEFVCMADLSPGEHLSREEAELQRLAREVYEQRLKLGVAREQARKDLPLSTYTEIFWKCDLRNLLGFLSLRMDTHAQEEIRAYATILGEQIVAVLWPECWAAFNEYDHRRGGMLLSRTEVELICDILGDAERMPYYDGEFAEGCKAVGWSVEGRNRERDEALVKLKSLGVVQ